MCQALPRVWSSPANKTHGCCHRGARGPVGHMDRWGDVIDPLMRQGSMEMAGRGDTGPGLQRSGDGLCINPEMEVWGRPFWEGAHMKKMRTWNVYTGHCAKHFPCSTYCNSHNIVK